MNKARRNFDLPAIHITETDGAGYRPPKAYDPEEIARRTGQRPGTLIREYQASGLVVASSLFEKPATEPEDINYIRRRLAVPLLNSAWYAFADSAKSTETFMRRELKLPVIADDEAEWRASKQFMLTRVREGLASSASLASRLVIQYRDEHEIARVRTEKKLGRTMGNTALWLINLQHANAPLGMSEQDIQDVVMLDALTLLDDARTSYEPTGIHESVAQFADPESPLARNWRDAAPRSREALHALVQSQDDFGIAA
ncbi:MAG: hypothetical protein JWO07_477 [Candidatus Saccharibacteria bacterium]|nr:hypothetical protein [Candidatus Saccharibacteria bacterium]